MKCNRLMSLLHGMKDLEHGARLPHSAVIHLLIEAPEAGCDDSFSWNRDSMILLTIVRGQFLFVAKRPQGRSVKSMRAPAPILDLSGLCIRSMLAYCLWWDRREKLC